MALDEGCRKKKKRKKQKHDFEIKLCGKIKTSIVQVCNCARLLMSQCSCQLRKFCIDNSTEKFISLVVQIYLAGLAIANSFGETASDC